MKRASGLAILMCGALGCGLGTNQPSAQAESNKADKKGTVVELDDLRARTPANWKTEQPSNEMRAYQFQVPATKGDKQDAEMVIFYFGQGGGGNAADNVKRWKGLFNPPAGKTTEDVSKVTEMKVGQVQVTYLDIHGTYKYKKAPFVPDARAELRPHYRMLAVVFESPKGPYFFRLVGPEKTVQENKKGFDDWLKGFK